MMLSFEKIDYNRKIDQFLWICVTSIATAKRKLQEFWKPFAGEYLFQFFDFDCDYINLTY